MPRKPLLGKKDYLFIKQKRSFTFQAEQTIWDIGHPQSGVEKLLLIISEFRIRLEGGEFPIHRDHSGSLSESRLAWTTEVQDLEFRDIMPKLIEGFLDKMPPYRAIAMMALKDIIKHGDPNIISEAIPNCIFVIGKVLKYYNEISSRLVLTLLKCLLTHCDSAGPILAPYLGRIFMFYNPYMIDRTPNTCNMEDKIYYRQFKEMCMSEFIEQVMQLAELKAGNEGMLAAIKLKEGIPSFQSRYIL